MSWIALPQTSASSFLLTYSRLQLHTVSDQELQVSLTSSLFHYKFGNGTDKLVKKGVERWHLKNSVINSIAIYDIATECRVHYW